jgi:hypothetical protein
VPGEENDPTFQGFSSESVSVESNNAACPGVCLVNHFQGRVTCPYGQTAPGVGPQGPAGSPAAAASSEWGCGLPGAVPGADGYVASDQITATDVTVAGYSAGSVPPQITGAGVANRTANNAVYCSCRCENADGKTDDGASYCTCPAGYTCTQLVASLGGSTADLAGGYCMLIGTGYSPDAGTEETCAAAATDPAQPGYCSPQR